MSKKPKRQNGAKNSVKQDKKPQPAANRQVKTVKTLDKQQLVETIVVNVLLLLVFLAFGYIAVMSVFQTSVIDSQKYINEKILYQGDMIALNLLLTALFAAFLFFMRRYYDFFAKVNMRAMEIGMTALVVFAGLLWVLTVRSIPAADSYNLYEAASDAAQGKYTSMQNYTQFYNSAFYNGYSYFHFYPFQLGFVALSELIYRIFGANSMCIQVLNVLCVGASYFALARITKLLFKRKSAEFIAILLLAGCLQPVLFCTFVYGNIIGMCGAIWASLFLIKYFQTGQYRWIYPSGGLLVLSTLHYEMRSGTEFAEGVSQTLYLDMGLRESYMAPGWYGTIAKDTYINYYLTPKFKGDPNASIDNANAVAQKDIDTRLQAFGNIDYAADFFSKKILSQWNEPTFESIWVSKVKHHTPSDAEADEFKTTALSSEQMRGLPQAVYYKSLGQALELHFNFYMQIVYIMFAVGIYLLFIRKKSSIETVLLPLVLLGAFGYHLLFEGKSQYILTYIPLLIPTAAYAFTEVLGGKYERIKRFVEKINHIPAA